MIYNINELDVFYISYDEPNKEECWSDLVSKCPWARRIDGVKGFDAAHKACAENSSTELFMTVDGDNKINQEIFGERLVFDSEKSKTVYSFSAKNTINGLIYGNGGIKIWPKQLVVDMKTHENAEDDQSTIDFCWKLNYQQMNNVYSEVHANGSPLQAFRAGYREGVKMSLSEGVVIPKETFRNDIFHKNLQRLLIWLTVGEDVEHGEWAIYGARLGCVNTVLEGFDITNVNDYDWFDKLWITEKEKIFDTELLKTRLERELGINVASLDESQSRFFKSVFVNPLRVHPSITERELHKFIPKEFQ